MAEKYYNRTERAVLKLIREAQNHEAYMGQDGTNAQGSGLSWLRFVIEQGRLKEDLKGTLHEKEDEG
jgi:hypothetical protein